jgi:3-hydroxybutyryl-CoA dehydratase
VRSEAAVGELLPERRFLVDGAAMKVFSVLMADPNPIHFDPDFVRRLGLGEKPVNQGTITMSYAITAVVEWAGGVERLRRFTCRFRGSVFADDEITAGGEVTAVDVQAGETLATLDVWLARQTGERPVVGTAVVSLGAAS